LTLRSIHSEERLVSRAELAEMIGCSEDTIDAMRKKGMPEIRWGRRIVRFRPSRALAWLEENDGLA